MAYLTKSNANRIIGQADLKNMTLPGVLYERPIYFFNRMEANRLLAFYNFYKNPEIFVSIFKKIESKDKLEFVWEGYAPAYHKDNTCEKIHSNFQNTRVPEHIREEGEEAVMQFRKWFKKADKNEKFRNLSLDQLESVKYNNSGQENFNDINLEELNNDVNSILDNLAKFIASSDKIIRKIIVTYDKYTYFASKNLPFPTLYSSNLKDIPKDMPLFDKTLGINEDDLRAFLIDFETRFKIPVANRLKNYYQIKYNPELSFEGTLLEQLGFRKCSFCFPKE